MTVNKPVLGSRSCVTLGAATLNSWSLSAVNNDFPFSSFITFIKRFSEIFLKTISRGTYNYKHTTPLILGGLEVLQEEVFFEL